MRCVRGAQKYDFRVMDSGFVSFSCALCFSVSAVLRLSVDACWLILHVKPTLQFKDGQVPSRGLEGKEI